MEKPAPEREGLFSPGETCDGYRIRSLIAKGGMGDVYEAEHAASGRVVALKCLKVKHLRKEDARGRMKMEAIVLSELQHANLVQVYDAGVTDFGMVWFAMERLHGQTLRELLHRRGKVPVIDALHYASEIADGVDAVHEVNVIHRDLKPENVFITRQDEVKVLDLGTGKFAGYGLYNTDRMKVVGTTAYMSPEHIRGLRIDARADIYALGLMVYEMIAGRHPLAPAGSLSLFGSPEQIALRQLETIPPNLAEVEADCPSYVARMVHRAIAKNRDERHSTMGAFCRELRVARKRFTAERGVDDPMGGSMKGERLREKLGARPPFGGERDRLAELGRGDGYEPSRPAEIEMQLANTVVDPFPVDGSEPAVRRDTPSQPRAAGALPKPAVLAPDHDPTVELTGSSIPVFPEPLSDRPPVGDDVRNRTTNTNPIGLLRPVDLTPEPHSLPGGRRPPIWSRAGFRRSAVTLGLGAAIGIPPAIVGVFYRAHRQTEAPMSVASPEPAGPAVESPLAVAAESADLTARLDPPRISEPMVAPSALPAPLPSAIRPARTYRPARIPARGEAATRPAEDNARKTPVLDTPSFPVAGAAPTIDPTAVRSASPAAPSRATVTLPPSGL